jgi:hypothetical protein
MNDYHYSENVKVSFSVSSQTVDVLALHFGRRYFLRRSEGMYIIIFEKKIAAGIILQPNNSSIYVYMQLSLL